MNYFLIYTPLQYYQKKLSIKTKKEEVIEDITM